jgi:hypothetical protein
MARPLRKPAAFAHFAAFVLAAVVLYSLYFHFDTSIFLRGHALNSFQFDILPNGIVLFPDSVKLRVLI